MRRHNISDWNLFYATTGKTDYARCMGNFIAARFFVWLMFLPLQLLIWSCAIGLQVIVLAYNRWADHHNKQVDEYNQLNLKEIRKKM